MPPVTIHAEIYLRLQFRNVNRNAANLFNFRKNKKIVSNGISATQFDSPLKLSTMRGWCQCCLASAVGAWRALCIKTLFIRGWKNLSLSEYQWWWLMLPCPLNWIKSAFRRIKPRYKLFVELILLRFTDLMFWMFLIVVWR